MDSNVITLEVSETSDTSVGVLTTPPEDQRNDGVTDKCIEEGLTGDIYATVAGILNDTEVQEALDVPSVSESQEEENTQPRFRRRRKGENVKSTPLQIRYDQQLRDRRVSNDALVDEMSRLVAVTWMPGRDRKECPPIVDVRDARLMVMDRFPMELGGLCDQIGLSMYRADVTKQGRTHYASPANVELFKNFAVRPHFRAGGQCLDSRNEDVFRTALALDQAMELVARGKLDPTPTFAPPPVLFGFPRHYVPSIEWRTPMMDAVCKQLHPEAPALRCLLSPGGTVTEIVSGKDNINVIKLERNNQLHQVRVPDWITILPHVRTGSEVVEGQPLADLPRGVYGNIKEVNKKYSFIMLQWLELRILDELTEMISIDEAVYDKQAKACKPITTTWCCVPAQFVQTQASRTVRNFLDFRRHLGRQEYTLNLSGEDLWSKREHQVRIDVMQFASRPTITDVQFRESADEKHCTWYADLMTAPDGAKWASRCSLRGVTDYAA